MASKDCQEGGIVFGDWKLFPVDSMNWELCHRHETKDTKRAVAAGTAGQVRWNRTGRFYQHNTFDLAIQYAADVELKAKAHAKVIELWDALEQYRDIIADLKADMLAELGGDAR